MTAMEAEIAVVGGGPSGLMAATVAATAGASVLLIEEQERTGGRLGLQRQLLQGPRSIYQGLSGLEFCRRLLGEAASAGVEVMLDTSVIGLRTQFPGETGPFLLTLEAHSGLSTVKGSTTDIQASAVVLANGSWESWSTFPGSDLPGVMLSDDVQVVANHQGIAPGRSALVAGSDNAGLLVAADLLAIGCRVVAVVDESPCVRGRQVNALPLRDAGVPLLTRTRVVAVHGDGAVESVSVARIDPGGVGVAGTELSFAVDTICLAGPRRPETRLAAQAGCSLSDVEHLGGVVPVCNRRMGTPIAGLYLCGDAAGVENGAVSMESGRLAGLWAAADLGHAHPEEDSQERLARARLGYLRRGPRGLMRRRARTALASEYHRIVRAGRIATPSQE